MRARIAFTALWFAAVPLAAQSHARIDITLPPPASFAELGPTVSTTNLLNDPKTHELLNSGFSTRIHYRLELWKHGGVFDDPVDTTGWDVLVSYDPTAQRYNVVRREDSHAIENFGGFPTVELAEQQFDRPFRLGLHPTARGRYYYALTVEIETLRESDLDALQQWLRGPSSPSRGNPLKSLRTGLRTLLSRVLGGGKRVYGQRTGIFTVGGE
ncbi:MAG TPA: hypothetical protein VHB25_05925 [Gemmatimonadaceae bacterium]|nr:hypothetical protein [Gemmatimonadaceae bacterium]